MKKKIGGKEMFLRSKFCAYSAKSPFGKSPPHLLNQPNLKKTYKSLSSLTNVKLEVKPICSI
ncbi:hypothetical protein A2955_03120 [Candidatus Woesebacteria bacterium RIFCSPLOWO2_01_FULL_37_19]|uniref:Uncharacterized protein n=1 Tax=Candidatus Woesebacteria bacterium RIFCSPLOWO2_01_FULL_37_19 TaxID=1802514 RepID=A0A1F8B0A9_9BACT|nr:MAG: hypothetical protein A2955_03120 [Candidatus Woesebacteria bacterium RIFCSPLOWO2_01_FULL_37_19]